ncbi:CoA ester lyase [Phenylobacterium sp.]|uniref:HpcH/HpaI aldolase/citrate lyase family protein n=1 Tax=Phenylobacterium sp. TaxID=1871053 RepID=UPI002896C33C|nr:CoA ester lyase [Phenylobacterium sp.]
MTPGLGFRAPLFVPADRPERFAKAAASGADAVILDLEDAVAPSEKARARGALAVDFADVPVIVRVNAAGTPWHKDDLAAVAQLDVAAVMIPKVEYTHALEPFREGPPLIILIESAAGVANARTLAAQVKSGLLAFGSVDYAADLGCAHDRWALLHARSEIVLASRLGGLPPPLDGVTLAVGDPATVADDADHGRSLGFGGKLCIHPSQVAPTLGAYRPSQKDLDWARRVLEAGEGVATVDGQMVDEPVRRRARRILDER